MKTLKKILAWLFKAFAALAILLILFAGTLYFLSRQERAIAREFITLLAQRQYSSAHKLVSAEMKQQYPLDLMKSQFEQAEPYTSVWFNSVSLQNGQTILVGFAKTGKDCSSPVVFFFVDEKTANFQLDDPCESAESSA